MTNIESKDPCGGEGDLTPEDRKQIISRIHSLVYWVGKLIPEEYEIGDKTLDLRDFVFHYIEKENPSEEERQDALALAAVLKKRADDLETEIKKDDLTRPQACDIMNEICGILRAVDELRTTGGKEAGIKRVDLMKRVNDARRWDKFIKSTKER